MAESGPDPSLSMIRRKLISATAADASESVDFDHFSSETEEPALSPELSHLLKQPPKTAAAPAGYDDVEALLQRYQAEKGLGNSDHGAPLPPPAAPAPRPASADSRNGFNNGLRQPPPRGLPPLSRGRNSEVQRLETENAELRQLVNEYREVLEANDPTIWEQKVAAAEQAVAEKDTQLQDMQKRVEEWDAKFKTHRFVPQDDELAHEADELDKERAKIAQDRKQLEGDRQQLKEDEDGMMKQMREMEVGMAKDRAELARQRTEIQRLHGEIKHELEQMQRGDASVKERLAQFQRRYQEALSRPGGMPTPILSPAATPPTAPPVAEPTPPPRARETGVFKKLFGQ